MKTPEGHATPPGRRLNKTITLKSPELLPLSATQKIIPASAQKNPRGLHGMTKKKSLELKS